MRNESGAKEDTVTRINRGFIHETHFVNLAEVRDSADYY